jgi:hypothetical protein
MSDQAVVWKFAFGALVLLFCAIVWVARKEAEPRAAAPAGAPVRTAPASAPLPAATAPPAAREPAPADLAEAQEAPVRIRIALVEPRSQERPAVVETHRAAKHAAAAKAHRAHARQAQRKRPRYVSPYAIGRVHYPFDPRERWRPREG